MNKWMKTYWRTRRNVFEHLAIPLFGPQKRLEYEFNFAKKIKDYKALVLFDPELIQFIENPSEEIQLLAIKSGGHGIIHLINNPTEKVQLNAVNKRASLIEDIKNPTEKVQLVAVNQWADAIAFIENPTEEVQLVAVNKNGWRAIRNIQNPTEKVQLIAVERDGISIRFIENPTPKVIELARSQGYDREGNSI